MKNILFLFLIFILLNCHTDDQNAKNRTLAVLGILISNSTSPEKSCNEISIPSTININDNLGRLYCSSDFNYKTISGYFKTDLLTLLFREEGDYLIKLTRRESFRKCGSATVSSITVDTIYGLGDGKAITSQITKTDSVNKEISKLDSILANQKRYLFPDGEVVTSSGTCIGSTSDVGGKYFYLQVTKK
ncbi:hypothetical protein LPTSP4_09720 [Leptospira ryugenii]|uniref:Uncharacterized protein n=1 Tax=Leptospira ryugenii TaxID=1917863 RepID=A0A2P2DXV9_9LEPT|nr:hypothetical protein [Leptospira ryugenii]GBF49459.1 hypothetical protein LPTSP4_09720 [Leptospira ryugenii]